MNEVKIHILGKWVKCLPLLWWCISSWLDLFEQPCVRMVWYCSPYSEVKFNFMVHLFDLFNSMFEDFLIMIQNIDLTWCQVCVNTTFHTGITGLNSGGRTPQTMRVLDPPYWKTFTCFHWQCLCFKTMWSQQHIALSIGYQHEILSTCHKQNHVANAEERKAKLELCENLTEGYWQE